MPIATPMHHHRSGATRLSSRRARWGLAVGTVALVVGSLSPTSGAQAPEGEPTPEQVEALEATLALAPDQPPSPDDPFVEVVETAKVKEEAAAARMEATARSRQADGELVVATVARDDAKAKLDAAAVRRVIAEDQLAQERDRMSKLTVHAYVNGGETDFESYGALLEGNTTDPAAGRQILFGQVVERQEAVIHVANQELSTARRALSAARKKHAAAVRDHDRRAETAAARGREKADAEAAHTEAIADDERAQARLRSAGGGGLQIVGQDVAIIGLPRLSAEDLAGWFRTTTYRPRVSTPIDDYARWFIEEGNAEGIRGDVAFAQAVLETGGFANNDSVNANNFSGIGHCDLCPSGWTFPSPRMGVRAQIQLLKSYAVRKPEYANPLVDSRLRGPAGCCDTWGDLTTVWATDPTYGPKVMIIYSTVVQYALGRRARGEGFEPAA